MAEYIYEIESHEDNESEIFIGWIRNHSQELIRCKDCKFHHERTRCKKRIGAWFDEDFCNGAVRAERKEE